MNTDKHRYGFRRESDFSTMFARRLSHAYLFSGFAVNFLIIPSNRINFLAAKIEIELDGHAVPGII